MGMEWHEGLVAYQNQLTSFVQTLKYLFDDDLTEITICLMTELTVKYWHTYFQGSHSELGLFDWRQLEFYQTKSMLSSFPIHIIVLH